MRQLVVAAFLCSVASLAAGEEAPGPGSGPASSADAAGTGTGTGTGTEGTPSSGSGSAVRLPYVFKLDGPLPRDLRKQLMAAPLGLKFSRYLGGDAYLECLDLQTLSQPPGGQGSESLLNQLTASRYVTPLWHEYLSLESPTDECPSLLPTEFRAPGASPGTTTGYKLKLVVEQGNLVLRADRAERPVSDDAPIVDAVSSSSVQEMLEQVNEQLLRAQSDARGRRSQREEAPIRSAGAARGASRGQYDGADQVVNLIDSWPVFPNHEALEGALVPAPLNDAPDSPATPHAHPTFLAGLIAARGEDASREPRGPRLRSTRLAYDWNLETLLGEAASGREPAAIHVAAWHYDAPYDDLARAVDRFTWLNEEQLFVGTVPYRSGAPKLATPGCAKNALTVGAPPAPPDRRSSRAEEANRDDRRKPDLWARGCDVISTVGDEREHDDGWDIFNVECATSWAAAVTAATAARARQYYMGPSSPLPPGHLPPSGALLKATLINATRDANGWGRPNLQAQAADPGDEILDFDGLIGATASATARAHGTATLIARDVRHDEGLATRESHAYEVKLHEHASLVRVTLAWSDAPPYSEFKGHPIVNDLDLIVKDAAGQRIWPPGSDGQEDRRNSVEQVTARDLSGSFTVEVVGAHVPVAPHADAGQGYALVIWTSGKAESGPRILLGNGTPASVGTYALPSAPPDRKTDRRGTLSWMEANLAAGGGLLDGGDGDWLGAASAEYRHATFQEIPEKELPGISGLGAGRNFRKNEVSFGVTTHRGAAEDRPSFATDHERAWGYFQRALTPRNRSRKGSWGLLGDVQWTDTGDGAKDSSASVSPAWSMAWDSEGDCERNRAVVHATYSDLEDADAVAGGVTFSFLRPEDGDRYDDRCIEASPFRLMTLDDHRNYHVSYEHRALSREGGRDERTDYVSFLGQVPIKRFAPEYRHVTFDWYAAHAWIVRDPARPGAAGQRESLLQADVGVMAPLARTRYKGVTQVRELGIRLGFGGRWYDSDASGVDVEDAVVTLTFHAQLKAGRARSGRAVKWPDVPASGSTLNPESGTGPGGFTPRTP